MEPEYSYIGTKVVKAVPMTECAWLASKGEDVSNREDRPGYRVTYEDGYKSWSPQETFDRSYRRITEAEKKLIQDSARLL